jgi:selenocysteine-specific translation elongation factor
MSPISEETFRNIQNSDVLTLSVDILVATDAVARALRDRLDMIVVSDPRYAEVEKQMQAAERERAEAIVELIGFVHQGRKMHRGDRLIPDAVVAIARQPPDEGLRRSKRNARPQWLPTSRRWRRRSHCASARNGAFRSW